jgi:hypothetical protein
VISVRLKFVTTTGIRAEEKSMTEQEWLDCTEAHPMLEFLLKRRSGTATEMRKVAGAAMRRRSGRDRKFRLFACGWTRHFWDSIEDRRLQDALNTTEDYADGIANGKAFKAAKRQARAVLSEAMAGEGQDGWKTHIASFVSEVMSLRFLPGWNPTKDMETGTRDQETERHSQELGRYQCGLLCCIFGNPFRPITLDPSWLTPRVVSLAQEIYDNRAFDRLPLLADALEQGGCKNTGILNHCRGPEPHVRGCWVVDLLLGRG